MIAEFINRQTDFIILINALAFITLFVVCANSRRENASRLPWIHLEGFALLAFAAAIAEIIPLTYGDTLVFSILRIVLKAGAFAFLLEFGRAGLKALTGRGPGRWIHIPLLGCVGLGAFAGLAGVVAVLHLVYVMGGGLWAAAAFWFSSRRQNSRALFSAGLMMAVYTVVGIVIPGSGAFSTGMVDQANFVQRTGIPIQLFLLPVNLYLAYSIWLYHQKIKPLVFSEDGSRPRNAFELRFVIEFCAVVLLGWIAADFFGQQAEGALRQELLSHTNLAESMIPVGQFQELHSIPSDVGLPAFGRIQQIILDLIESDARIDDIYLMQLKNGRIYFAVDSALIGAEDFDPPGVEYLAPPLELYDVFLNGKTRLVGPYMDEYGSFLSGFAAIRDLEGTIIGVVGLDIRSEILLRTVGQTRLLVLGITLLVFVSFLGMFLSRERTWEARQRIAANQRLLTQAQSIAKLGSWTWSFASNHLVWSEETYRIFGRDPAQEVADFSDFQQYFDAQSWAAFTSTTQKAMLSGKEFRMETVIHHPERGERCILMQGKIRLDETDRIVQLMGIAQDITEQKQADEKVRILFRAIEQSPISVVITNSRGEIEYVNPKFCDLTGYSLSEAIGQNPRILKTGETSTEEYTSLWESILSGKEWQGEFLNRKKNGDLYWESAVISPITDESGKITHFVAVKEDITERKKAAAELHAAHEALEATNRELEQASQVKSQFLANMSHEIRTPLNAIIGMTGLLLDTPLNKEQTNFAETVRTSGEVLLVLINDILDFSKIEAQKMELENQSFDLRRCIEEALDLVVTKAVEKKIELSYLIEDDIPAALIGDVTRLRQILVNLLSNAIKFTETGEVAVSVKGQMRDQQQYHLHFTIRDTGIGIPPERLNRLFQSFSQIDASTTRRFGGTGLGLAISKRLSELMGGTMWVESAGVAGQGSTFHFTILAREAPEQPPSQGSEPLDLSGLRILIVDDNKTNRDILQRYTESWKMIPSLAATPHDALELVEKSAFDLAILDLQMPEMDGMTLAREIQARLNHESFPLILLSSLGYHEAKGEESRFTAYLTKPIKPSMLFDTLGTTLNRKPTQAKKKTSISAARSAQNLGLEHPLRILVVDDNNVNQIVATSLLGKIGYRADLASNGLEALDALYRQPYDVVLMDGQMPEMDGEEATRQIRRRLPASLQPTIVAMTANAMQGDRERYLACGMDDYISKPIRVEELVRILSEAQPLQVELAIQSEPVEPGEPAPAAGAEAPVAVEQADPPGNESAAVDPAVLQEFQDLLGGEEGQAMVADLVQLYLADSPVLIANMRAALPDDCENLRLHAHTLKGNSYQTGAGPLAEACAALEKLAKGGSSAGAAELIDQIEGEFERVKACLLENHRIPSA